MLYKNGLFSFKRRLNIIRIIILRIYKDNDTFTKWRWMFFCCKVHLNIISNNNMNLFLEYYDYFCCFLVLNDILVGCISVFKYFLSPRTDFCFKWCLYLLTYDICLFSIVTNLINFGLLRIWKKRCRSQQKTIAKTTS